MIDPQGGLGAGMRWFRREQLPERKLAKGTVKRIARFAAPYKKMVGAFLALIVVDAIIGAVTPWLYAKVLIDNGILAHNRTLVVQLAILVAILAVVDAGVALAMRWFSARIGEGLIFDMRSKVFRHVQRMPIAFFTRTQTGALVTRLNNDVLGAQQAFTGTLSTVVSNIISVTLVLVAMFVLSWPITLVSLGMLPVFISPARWMGRRMQAITRESYALNAKMNTTMTERFNVAGALLVKLFGRSGDEASSFERRAGRVRDIGVQQAMYSRVFFVS